MSKMNVLVSLTIAFFMLVTPASLSNGESRTVDTMAWSPDGRQLAIGIRSEQLTGIEVYDGDGNFLLKSIPSTGHILSMDWNFDGTKIAALVSGTPDSVHIWDLNSRQTPLITIPQEGATSTNDVLWSPDGRFIATARSTTIDIWGADTGTLQAELSHPNITATQAFEWHPAGSQLWAADEYKNVRVWDIESQTIVEEFQTTDLITAMAFTPDGAYSAFGTTRGSVIIRDLISQSNELVWQAYSGHDLSAVLYHLDWSLDGQILVASNNKVPIMLFDVMSERATVALNDFAGATIKGLDLSPYGGRLAIPSTSPTGFDILTPAPSLEQLSAIAALCARDATTQTRSVTTLAQPVTTLDALPAFVAQLDSLPEGAIPPACAADLRAVATALQE
jgi:WD40 repeat protein